MFNYINVCHFFNLVIKMSENTVPYEEDLYYVSSQNIITIRCEKLLKNIYFI